MLRKRKNKRYIEEANDEEGDRSLRYEIRDKILSERFEHLKDLQELPGEQVTLKLIQRNGFDKPILVNNPDGLDLAVPQRGFVVRDVGKLVGYDRMIDVMDVRTQKNIEMSMRDWCKYYESRSKDRLLNVISLEFSHTELASQVDSPRIVKLLDWVDLVWPKFLKESQTESTNTIDKMKYPKVQKYCLMSVKGSYTDFHIDFGGTSVWYHILRGKKIFWMAPPTELNLQAFEEWTLSGMQQDVFFGDTVEECFRVELTAGNTFFIPSGWIHAVYTVEDSLVFGGNFLHSFGIENQLKVSKIEDATKVPVKFRYPFYTEILWYVVQHYVYCLTGKSHLQNSPKNSATTTPEKNSKSIVEATETKDRPKADDDDTVTESEYDDCDKTKRKKVVKSKPSKKKRGRPHKTKTPTDDESTEIDSDYEDAKPTKRSTTCRMTKNSLLRLQYELDEPQALIGQSSPNRSSKLIKAESTSEKSAKKSKNKTIQSPVKAEVIPKSDSLTSSNNLTQAETIAPETPNSVSSVDKSRLNGWSGANKSIWSNSDSEPKGPHKIHITKTELTGLKLLVKHLSKLSGAKKNMPNLIRNSRALLDDCKKVIAEHENDDPDLAVTGLAMTPDLLNSKKSDINQLIEQFFRPSDSASNDEVSNDKAKTDSTTLTMQHRLKYNQMSNHVKVDDRKISSPPDDSVSLKNPNQKDSKASHLNKKSTCSSSPTLATSNNLSSNVAATAVDQPRPKSPPTRPLSNKQYSSKTKNDKSDNNLVLPGSFADLIAATSAPKEVFNVSSADVTSSLFGLKSPSKSSLASKEKQPTSLKPPQRSPFNIDSILPSTTSDNSKDQFATKKDESPKPSSPEPPKVTTPTKRFITPAQNRLQVKEKLIYASAPYFSPVNAPDHSRFPYMWQHSANMQPPHHNPPSHQQSRQPNQFPPSHNNNVLPQPIEPPKPSPSQANAARLVSKQSTDQIKSGFTSSEQAQRTNPISSDSNYKQLVQESPDKPVSEKNDTKQIAESLSTNESHGCSNYQNDSSIVGTTTEASQPKESLKSNLSVSSHLSQVPTSITQSRVSVDEQKIKKPRGPPKKSKEARQVIETGSPNAVPAIPISVIKSTSGGQLPVITQSNPPSSIDNPPSTQNVTDSKEKSKLKRVKNKKDESDAVSSSSANIDSSSSLQARQTRAPLICGLVAPPAITTNSSSQLPKPGQQYLISRPVLFNTMPAFSSAHLPQHLPPTSMPLFTTSMPSSMGLHNMQPGARILWATRPQAPTPISSASFVPRPTAAPSAQPKKKASKPATPTNLQVRQPDNTALLSLATTALSTAPLPTPTLSNIGARLPNPAQQAYMVNPNLFAQQYYNPFMQQIPMVQFAPGATNSALMAGTQFRPGIPRPAAPSGRLLFAPLVNQTGQPRYLITQPGFMPRPQAAPLYSGHQAAPNLPFVAFQAAVGPSSTKESAKVKKVKTR